MLLKNSITAGFLLFLLSGCISPPPKNVTNICHIFKQYPNWYWDTQDVARCWKVPIAVQMAIIHQESKFNGGALPPRTKLLWIIPWKRPSSAYGYTQALQTTWQHYKNSSDGGSYWSSRDEFSDAVDFIGWYANQANKRARIAPNDAYRLYLAYHDGIGGYMRKTYLRKTWLLNVARKVEVRAGYFQLQLNKCQHSLSRKPWYKIW